MFKFFTINSFDFSNKVVLVRIDINSPIIDGKIVMNERIIQSAQTLKELKKAGAKLILISHQGRKGKSDFVSLKNHLDLLKQVLKTNKLDFLEDFNYHKLMLKIELMKKGDMILLENLRFFDFETSLNVKNNVFKKLESLFDFYVFDAFSVAHRNHSSVLGFKNIPTIAGRLMEKELLGLGNILETPSPHTFVFGGAKPDDLINLLETSLEQEKVDTVLLGGVIGELALYIKGFYLGKKFTFLEEHGFLSSRYRLKNLLSKFEDKIFLPKDVAIFNGKQRIEIDVSNLKQENLSTKYCDLVDNHMIFDIGKETIKFYDLFIQNSGSIYFKGPMGNFEEKNFDLGTKEVLNSITSSKSFSFLGGGHSITAADKLGYLNKFSYSSLAGGALVQFLSGHSLPGIEALESSYSNFEGIYEDFIVIGSNVLDEQITIPKKLSDVELGEKLRINSDFKKSIGGGGVNVSICLSRLKSHVGYLGKLSSESHILIKESLSKNKVKLIDSKLTNDGCAKSVLIDTKDRDRVIFTFRGQNSKLEYTDFNIDDFKSNYYYLTSLSGQSFLTEIKLIKAIKKRNSKSIFCYSASSSLVKSEPKLKNLIKLLDIVVLNYEEAQELTKKESIEDCLLELKKHVKKLVIITDGSMGSYAFDGNKKTFMKAIKTRVVDSTGAGDAFSGTFFYFYSKGFPIKKSMELASINAASVVSKKGAIDGLLTYDKLIKYK